MLEQPVIQLKRGFARRQSVQIEDFWVDFLVTVQKRYCLNCKIARRHIVVLLKEKKKKTLVEM